MEKRQLKTKSAIGKGVVYALLGIRDSANGLRTLIYAVVMTALYFLSYMIQQRWVFAPQKNN